MPYVACGTGSPVCLTDSHTTGTRYAMISTMYWATWVHVTARMPPEERAHQHAAQAEEDADLERDAGEAAR